MSAPPGPKTMEVIGKLPPISELIKQRPDVPSEKPKVEKTVGELEAARRELEVACHAFAGADGKGGVILELTELLKSEEKEEAALIEMLGANADLEAELEPARKARAEDQKQIESLKRAYDSLLVQIAELNRQIREVRDSQVKEGKKEVDQAVVEAEDLTAHAVMEPPPIPFAARDASIAKHQADLAAAPDVTEHAVLQPPPIPEAVRKASREKIPDLTEHAVAMDPPPISEEIRLKSIEQHNARIAKQTEAKASEVAPVTPEPAAKNEAGPESLEQAQAFLAEDQREKMEVRQRLLKLYSLYTKELLPQMQGIHDAAQKLGGIGADALTKQEGPFAALQRGAKLQLDDTKTIQALFTHLQTEAMGTTPQDIEARTRDVQLLTARLQMRMQSVQGFRNTLLSMRGGMPKGSAQEAALVGLDRVAGKSWKSLGVMQAEWQPIGGKVQARNGQEYHRLYRQAYGVITSERSKGSDVTIQIPEDVQRGMPKEVIPAKEDLSNIQGEAILVNIDGITQERAVNVSPDSSSRKTQEVSNNPSIEDREDKSDEPVSEADYQSAIELRKKMDAAETVRVDVAKDVMRRTRRLSADLDGVKTKEIQVLQKALSDVLLEADTVAFASSQKDRLDEHQGTIWVYNQRLIKALQHADEVARSGGPGLSDDIRATVRRLASFGEDLPELVESDEAERAKKIIDRFEIQKKQAKKLPRLSI